MPSGGLPDLQGARVLDIASHNGRWSYAALRSGAAHVTGVEIDPAYVEAAGRILAEWYPTDRFRFVEGDLLGFLEGLVPGSFDVVLNLGVMYHIVDQVQVLRLCRRLAPRLLVLDSAVIGPESTPAVTGALQLPGFVTRLVERRPREPLVSVTLRGYQDRWETIPSAALMEVWLEAAGFTYQRLDAGALSRKRGMGDYHAGLRCAWHCRGAGTVSGYAKCDIPSGP